MNELIATLRRIFDRLRGEFEARVGAELARSDRAKFLVGGIGLVLVLSLTVAIANAADRAKRDYRTAQIAYERLKGQVETGSWAERRAASQTLKLTL